MVLPTLLYSLAHVVLIGTCVATNFVILPVPAQMLTYTLSILYIGSHLSLRMNETDTESGENKKGECMTANDAMMFPVIGSCALCGLYVCYKFLPPYIVNMVLTTYLTVLGVAAVAETAYPVLAALLPSAIRQKQYHIKFGLPKFISQLPVDLKFDNVNILCWLVAGALGGVWLYTKHFSLHNLFAIAFSIQAIALISIGNFKIAAILLCGLFVYDIFWVFGTEVMVTVAKAFEGPAKLIFPLSFEPWKQAILGLGDIVIPGIFVAMCLRFDSHLHHEKTSEPQLAKGDLVNIHKPMSKLYFTVAMVCYAAALMTCAVVMLVFKAAQPALLYLVPYCLGGVLLAAAARGELDKLWSYTEEEEKKEGVAKEAAKDTTESAKVHVSDSISKGEQPQVALVKEVAKEATVVAKGASPKSGANKRNGARKGL